MAILREVKRIEAGNSLMGLKTQALNAINQLKMVKSNLVNLKIDLAADKDNFNSLDTAEIDVTILEIDTKTGKI